MAEIVNLRQFRKGKVREQRAAAAEQNRALHGRSKNEKQRDGLQAEKAERLIEAHRRETASDAPTPEKN
ncbi:MAG TPA: DUF4169 family protein [Mesorhizobium sp.]|jgi:hypothetical protein|uniref:DUF4169 family protein n=1 Tax=Mesorhizobium sp. TaxID=1871066 RepID=UPI002DDD6B79|nr:DUF4169 family protein [Mesorhizobium sp.]HEV2507536.1 DUF4169 family protein [Mesorhizobium sp.]